MKPPLLKLVLAGLCAVLVGCSTETGSDQQANRESPRETQIAEPREVVSEGLMVALGQAKNFHRKADVYLKDGNPEKAISTLEQVFVIRFPDKSPEAEDVMLDVHARLGKLHIAAGQLDRAMDEIDRGIGKATRRSFFLANLHTVRGEVFQARAALLEAEPSKAKKLRSEAIRAYDASIAINEELQRTLFEEAVP